MIKYPTYAQPPPPPLGVNIDRCIKVEWKHCPLVSLDRFRSRTRTSKTRWKWRQNGAAYPYMGTTRHFHVVFDVRVLDLNLSIEPMTYERLTTLKSSASLQFRVNEDFIVCWGNSVCMTFVINYMYLFCYWLHSILLVEMCTRSVVMLWNVKCRGSNFLAIVTSSIIILIRMNNYIMPHALSDIKSLHMTYYGWHDLPQGLWIINEYFKQRSPTH